MTTGTEQQVTVVAERGVVGIHRNSVGGFFLFRQAYVIFHVETLLEGRYTIRDFFLEKRAMLGRYREMEVHDAFAVGCCLSAFHKVLFKRCARSFRISVKFEKTLREISVVKAVLAEKCGYDILVTAVGFEGVKVGVIKFLCHFV